MALTKTCFMTVCDYEFKLSVILFFRGVRKLIHVKMIMKKHRQNKESIGHLFKSTVVDKYPNRVAFISVETGKSMTFTEADYLSNQVGNVFYGANYQKDDVVAIFMESSIEYACYWLGLSKIGVVSALINFNLKGDSLAHCINIAKAKAVIYSPSLSGMLNSNIIANFYYCLSLYKAILSPCKLAISAHLRYAYW